METNSEWREGRSRISANSDKAQLTTSTQSKMYESGILRTTVPNSSNLVQTPPTFFTEAINTPPNCSYLGCPSPTRNVFGYLSCWTGCPEVYNLR